MDWNTYMLLLNGTLVYLAALLWKRAPCWMQRIVVGLLVASFFILSFGYGMVTVGINEILDVRWWHVTTFGFIVEHMAVIMYVFRVIMQGGLHHGPATRRF
jgi:hypothetical protein